MAYQLDEIDTGILRLLQQDARLSNKELSQKLNRSANPIYVRVKRLEEEGYIKRYTAVVDPKKIGKGMAAYTQIKLKQHSQTTLNAFREAVEGIAEVMECFQMTGDFDFFLKIAVRDMDEYNQLLMEKLANLPEVNTIESMFVMAEIKNTNIFNL